MKTVSIFMISCVLFGTNSFAMREGRALGASQKTDSSAREDSHSVKWVGEIKDDDDHHTTSHDHQLQFIKDGKSYDIVDSPEIVRFHHATEKNYLVEIEAEKTRKTLFGGGDLIVKTFKVIGETSLAPHLAPEKRVETRGRGKL